MYTTPSSACSLDRLISETLARDAALIEPDTNDLSGVLERYFGFDSFRPLQESIINDTLAGRDVLALMPTGGGKSLCYQLPALVRPGLTVVVSPLIALMKDQVDSLRRHGISVAMLNSTIPWAKMQEVIAGLDRGQFRLLYVAPERLMQQSFLAKLPAWKVAMFAIDEAHCISDWGHDFRPEYRQLAELRLRFPETPIMALTATATDRVRADIVQQLGLRDPGIYVASFNRPNLTYRIEAKTRAYDRLLEFVRKRPGASGIVYCHTRKSTESLAERLTKDGIKALPYHAGMEARDRARNQEMFLADEVRVICATIAFGMGVNKPNIRFVVHYDLPKNIESYYQETGRAGRDGDPAECLLLFGASDVIGHERRIDEKTGHEREIARQQLEALVAFAESTSCRRRELLAYFGERFSEPNCGGCDNCGRREGRSEARPSEGARRHPEERSGPAENRTADARLFLQCLAEIIEASKFSVGVGWVVDVLRGASGDKITKFGHERLKLYGAGKHLSKDEWAHLGRELLRGDFLARRGDGLPVLHLTDKAHEVIRNGREVTVLGYAGKEPAATSGPLDDGLFERLRKLRLRLSQERQLLPFQVFTDAALRQMSRDYPVTREQFLRISGVAEKKLADFGQQFLKEIADHVESSGRKEFAAENPWTPGERKPLNESERETLSRFRSGESPDRMARERGLKTSTIMGHLALAAEQGESVDLHRLIPSEFIPQVEAAFGRLGWRNLTGVREMLGDRFDYGALRVFRAARLSQEQGEPATLA